MRETTRLNGCVMDFPTAWAFVRATDPETHHERCSWRTTHGALLCDCHVLWDEYKWRESLRPALTDVPPGEMR